MTKIHFEHPDKTVTTIKADNGISLMENAINNNIDMILGDCGGACACATCQIVLKEEQKHLFAEKNELEEDMLDFAFDVEENSRLSCQLIIEDIHEGLMVKLKSNE